jgi:hypothetical protein
MLPTHSTGFAKGTAPTSKTAKLMGCVMLTTADAGPRLGRFDAVEVPVSPVCSPVEILPVRAVA